MKITQFADDLFDLQDFARRLEKFIATELEFVDGSLVLALSSKFGSGKTTFFEMWKTSLESPEEDSDKPLVITLNAWESDYYGDPLFAIISVLVERLESKGHSAATIVNAAKDFGWFSMTLGGQVVKNISGIDAIAAGEVAKKKKRKREQSVQLAEDTFTMYQNRKTAMESLKKAISEFVAASKPRVLFLVDELDRCRPDYAISYLETIKHIFDSKGAVFILAADRYQLENSAKTAFGPDLDFDEYYRKFIHREISLPPITEEAYLRLASNYVHYYLERKGSRLCFMSLEQYQIENISKLIGALKLTPRQIQEVFRILGHIFSTTEEKKGRLRWCLALGSVVMAALKIGNSRVYRLLGARQLDPKEAIDYLNRLVGEDHAEWWFMLFLTGDGLQRDTDESIEGVMKRAGFKNEENEQPARREIGQWSEGWGHSLSSRFPEIYQKIGQIIQWR